MHLYAGIGQVGKMARFAIFAYILNVLLQKDMELIVW